MLHDITVNLALALVFCFVGGIVGVAMVIIASAFLPRIINKMTPEMDEAKEIARGNVAVAQYFGLVVSASIIGVSIVIAAAVLGGILAALH